MLASARRGLIVTARAWGSFMVEQICWPWSGHSGAQTGYAGWGCSTLDRVDRIGLLSVREGLW